MCCMCCRDNSLLPGWPYIGEIYSTRKSPLHCCRHKAIKQLNLSLELKYELQIIPHLALDDGHSQTLRLPASIVWELHPHRGQPTLRSMTPKESIVGGPKLLK